MAEAWSEIWCDELCLIILLPAFFTFVVYLMFIDFARSFSGFIFDIGLSGPFGLVRLGDVL